jgi:nucleoside-diphosphate-sugar epimerase
MTEQTIDDATIVNTDGTTDDQKSIPKIKFGFVVLVDNDGTMYIERNKAAIAGADVERDATLIEVRRYAQEIIFDLAAQAAAEYTTLRLSPPASQEPAN